MNSSYVAKADPRTELALGGKALYGDDFFDEEIALWFEDEREGYFDLYGNAGPVDNAAALCTYAQLAAEHGFKWLPERNFPSLQLDWLICRLPVWPRCYHATRTWHKIRPAVVAYVLRKP